MQRRVAANFPWKFACTQLKNSHGEIFYPVRDDRDRLWARRLEWVATPATPGPQHLARAPPSARHRTASDSAAARPAPSPPRAPPLRLARAVSLTRAARATTAASRAASAAERPEKGGREGDGGDSPLLHVAAAAAAAVPTAPVTATPSAPAPHRHIAPPHDIRVG